MVESYTDEVTIPDLLEAPGYGLLDNVTWVPGDSAGHWRGGIFWDVDCYESSPTISACFDGGPADVTAKTATWGRDQRGARAFTVFDRWDCSPVGRGLTQDDLADGQNAALRALSVSAAYTVESVFWSGNVGNTPAKVFPNLITISSSPVVTGTRGLITLQPSATLITGGLDVTEGLGLLEDALADCYHGRGWIHVPKILVSSLAQANLVTERGGKLYTYAGNLVVCGRGYDHTLGPNGVTNPAGVTQMYATSPVFAIKDTPRSFNLTQTFDRNVNTVEAIAEQTYLLGWHCCLIGVTVTTGGVEAGEVAGPAAAA